MVLLDQTLFFRLLNLKYNIIIIDNFSTGYIENLYELKKKSKKKKGEIYFLI